MRFNKNLVIGLFSCTLESYTSSLYVFAGPELKSEIFPYLSSDAATFFHYFILAMGLLCYTLGGNLFGLMGDKIGRKKALTYSSLGLAVATGLLGLIPLGFTGIGIYIPAILFTLLFCLQHFCSGGDYSSSAIFTIEHVELNNSQKIVYYSGLACVMSVCGLILAQYISGTGLWRLGCFTGFIGAIFAFYIRRQSQETPVFTAKPTPVSDDLYTSSKIEKSIVFIFAGFLCALYYYIFIFLTPHLFADSSYSLSQTNVSYFIVYAIALWAGGLIASKTALFKTTQNFVFILLLFLMLFGFVLPQLELNTNAVLLGFLVTLLGFTIGPQHAIYLKLFPKRERCQAIITSFTLGCAIIGGVTPFLCKGIYSLSGNLGLTVIWPIFCTSALLASLIIYERRPLKLNKQAPYTV